MAKVSVHFLGQFSGLSTKWDAGSEFGSGSVIGGGTHIFFFLFLNTILSENCRWPLAAPNTWF